MWCICAYVERSYISYACRVFVCMYVHTVGLHKDNMLIISDMAVCGVFVRMYECRAYACMYACRPSIRAYACMYACHSSARAYACMSSVRLCICMYVCMSSVRAYAYMHVYSK